MAKKGKGGKGKKGKKGPVDWAAQQTTRYVEVEVRNSVWQTLRFTQRMPTSTKIVRTTPDSSNAPPKKSAHPSAPSADAHTTNRVPVRAQSALVDLIIDKHKIPGMNGLNMFLDRNHVY